jgi:hypothetical protein
MLNCSAAGVHFLQNPGSTNIHHQVLRARN